MRQFATDNWCSPKPDGDPLVGTTRSVVGFDLDGQDVALGACDSLDRASLGSRFCLGWPTGSPIAYIFLELGWPDAAHISTSRLLSLFLARCTRCLQVIGALSPRLSSTPCFLCLTLGLRVAFPIANLCVFHFLVNAVLGLGPLLTVCGCGFVLALSPLTKSLHGRPFQRGSKFFHRQFWPGSSDVQISSVAFSILGSWSAGAMILLPEVELLGTWPCYPHAPFAMLHKVTRSTVSRSVQPFQISVNSGVVDVPCFRIPCHFGYGISGCSTPLLASTLFALFSPVCLSLGKPESALLLSKFHVVSSVCRCQFLPTRGSTACQFVQLSVLPRKGAPAAPLSALHVASFSSLPDIELRSSLLSSFTAHVRPEWLDVVSFQVAQQVYRMTVYVSQPVSSRCVCVSLSVLLAILLRESDLVRKFLQMGRRG